MFAMCIDNIFWISASPEYPLFKENKPITIDGKTYSTRIEYIFKYRIWSVLTHWRDIIPAIFTSLILAVLT